MTRLSRLTATIAVVTACAQGPPSIDGSIPNSPPTQVSIGAPVPPVSPTASASFAAVKADGQIVFLDDRVASARRQIYIERAMAPRCGGLSVSDYDDSSPGCRPMAGAWHSRATVPITSNIFIVNVDGTGLHEIDRDSCLKLCAWRRRRVVCRRLGPNSQ